MTHLLELRTTTTFMRLWASDYAKFNGQFCRRCLIRLSSRRSSTGGRVRKNTLSRKERRLQERLLKNKGVQTETEPIAQVDVPKSTLRSRLSRWMPMLPGGGSRFRREHLIAITKRLPFWLVLVFLFTSDETSPFVLDGMAGPSMLPTMHPVGDLYLRSTGAWHRLFGQARDYQVGDVVVWRHEKARYYSCKRIVGVEGQAVLLYGEYVDLYQHRPDWGICWPQHGKSTGGADMVARVLVDRSDSDMHRTLLVPPGHVWLEGDFPLASNDSRHFGPIPVNAICGRVVLRLWPLWRTTPPMDDSSFVKRQRPKPLLSFADAAMYNLHPIIQPPPSMPPSPTPFDDVL